MIKLFFRNKIVEVLNALYNTVVNYYLMMLIICGGLMAFLGLAYIAGFLTRYVHYGVCGTLNLLAEGNPLPFWDQVAGGLGILGAFFTLFMIIYLLGKIIEALRIWVRHNIILAKNKVKVKVAWKDSNLGIVSKYED